VEQDPAQMPLNLATGSGAEESIPGLEEHSSFGKDKGINGFLLVFLLLAVGAGAIWVMRMSGAMDSSSPDLSDAEKRINEALQRFGDEGQSERGPLKKLFADTNEAITVFSEDPVQNQVDLNQVQKNPFELNAGQEPEETERDQPSGPSKEEQRRRERAMRIQALRNKAEGLELQSLLSGQKSMAVISGEVVGVDDAVGPFTVHAISPYGVRLKAAGKTFTLRMDPSENSDSSSRRLRR